MNPIPMGHYFNLREGGLGDHPPKPLLALGTPSPGPSSGPWGAHPRDTA